MTFDGTPKNNKVSIQKKYKRRLRGLSRALDQYIEIARAKLDRSRSGNIYNRENIEHLVVKSTELSGMLSALEQSTNRAECDDHRASSPSSTDGSKENILIDGDEFFSGLTQEEWDELRNAFNKPPDQA